jgi:hypothetical protein
MFAQTCLPSRIRRVPVIGFMNAGSPQAQARLLAAFRQGLGRADEVIE